MKKSKVLFGLILTSSLILTTYSYSMAAALNKKYQNVDFKKYLEPDTSYLSLEEYKNKKGNSNNSVRKYFENYQSALLNLVGDAAIPSSYNLNKYIDIKAENQHDTNWCWAYAGLKSVETNLALKESVNYNFSEAHAAYMTSKDLGGKRNVSITDVYDSAANFQRLSEYFGTERFSKTTGPVLESQIPNQEYNYSDTNTLIGAKPIVTVKSVEKFPTILVSYGKKIDEYSAYELEQQRNLVKKHIMEKGSIYATICIPEGINSTNMLGKNYSYCKIESDLDDLANHAVSVVGWDDSYSRSNFNADNMPDHDGAYICLNSWGSSWGQNGYFYVSYEDAFIESTMYGVNNVSLTYEDTQGPSVVYTNKGGSTIEVDVYDIGGSGVDESSLKFKKTATGEKPDLSTFESFTNTGKIDMDLPYLWISATDEKGNTTLSSIGNVYFKDKNLYTAIKNNAYESANVLGYSDLTQKVLIGNIENVTQLLLLLTNVSDISGLENLYNLNELYLSYNSISDLTPLSNLTELEGLYLNTNQITDLTPLAKLTKMKKIDLAKNSGITDITPIEKFSELQYLNLEQCDKITNISIVGKFINLVNLYLTNCNINDVRFLSTLEGLEILDLDQNNLRNVDSISGLTKLSKLDISRNNLGNLGALSNLTNLTSLTANSDNLIDITGIAELNHLSTLALTNNKLTDVSVLNDKNISKLYLQNQSISIDIYPRNLTNQIVQLPQICQFIADRAAKGESAKITLTNATKGTANNTIVVDSTDTSKNVNVAVTGGCFDGTKIAYIYNASAINITCTKKTTNEWEKVQKVQVHAEPLNGATITGLQYKWADKTLENDAIDAAFVNDSILSTPEGLSGQYFLNILATLKLDTGKTEIYSYHYGPIKVDNTIPNTPVIIGNIGNGENTEDPVELSINCMDNTLSGISAYEISLDGGTTWKKITDKATVSAVGSYSAIARVTSKTGIVSKISDPYKFIIESGEIEVGKITYSTLEPTNQDVVATISFVDKTIHVTNNNGATTYTFKDNGTFIFEYEDVKGHKGNATAQVSNIIKEAPKATIKYSTTETTNQDVKATLVFEEGVDGITVTNNEGKDTYTFSENGTFTFEYKDKYGNKGNAVAKVDNINKTPSKATIKYSTETATNQYVTAEVSFENEGVVITNNNGDNTYVFSENGEFTFEYVDTLGNVGKAVAKVSNIDKDPPIATITYSTEEVTKDDVEVTINFNEENVVITNNRGFNKYVFKENGTFTFEYQDAAGNKGTTVVEVNNIDKSVVGATKLPDTGLHIAIIFGAILILVARFIVANKDEIEKVWILYKNRREFNHNNNR